MDYKNLSHEELREAWNDGLITRAEYREAMGLPVGENDHVYKHLEGNRMEYASHADDSDDDQTK